MKLIRTAETFHRNKVSLIKLRRRVDTGSHRFIEKAVTPPLTHYNRAGPAVSFFTPLLGTAERKSSVQHLQHGFIRSNGYFLSLSIQVKANKTLVFH